MKHDYLETSLWYREKIKNPYEVIAASFAAADVAVYRKIIKQLLNAAHSNHSWKKGSVGDLLHYVTLLESLINAAYLITKAQKKSTLCIPANDLFNPALYCNTNGNNWNCFPRSLSAKECIDPYITFKQFFTYLPLPKWKKELGCVLDYALSNMSLYEAGININLLMLYLHLTKLAEAAHLINVRE